MGELPSFLEAWDPQLYDSDQPLNTVSYRSAFFRHKRSLLPAHALWWSPKTADSSTILIFIPGNPGLLHFYTPFLTSVHDKSNGSLAILAHAHLGHTPKTSNKDFDIYGNRLSIGLSSQVESVIEIIDEVKLSYRNVVLVGHSVGSWLATQALKARPDVVSSIFLLFPTISHIASTPNGRRLSWLFRSPLPRLISYLSTVTRVIPIKLLSLIFSDWPTPQILVLRSLLHCPSAVFAALTMAHDEMTTIRAIDAALLQEHKHRLYIFYAEYDDWVGDQKDIMLNLFDQDVGIVRVVHGHKDIPHAFCINHGEQVAEQCYEWLLSGSFIPITPSDLCS